MNSLALWSTVAWRLILNWLIVLGMGIVLHGVAPAPSPSHTSLAVLAAVLGLLAAGIFTAFSSLSIEGAKDHNKSFYNAADVLLFTSMYLLLYLSLFCLYRIGILQAVGVPMEVLVHGSLGILLTVMHMVDVWDRAQNIVNSED